MAAKKTQGGNTGNANLWLFPSNHQNMSFMLASGLISDPAGFAYGSESRYYKDALSIFPGWIPLFKKESSIPDEIRRRVIEESSDLKLTVSSIDMSGFYGKVYVRSGAGDWQLVQHSDVLKSYDSIWVPAPLPISWIKSISFQSEKDKDAFLGVAEGYSNIDIQRYDLAVMDTHESKEELFPDGIDAFNPAELPEPIKSMCGFYRAQAVGGIFAMLYSLANASDRCLRVFQNVREMLFDQSSSTYSTSAESNPILTSIPHWFVGQEVPYVDDKRSSFFFGLLDEIVHSRENADPREATVSAREYAHKQEEELRGSWPRLPELLEEAANPECALSELFERYKGTVSHALLLFFLRDNCDELLEFQTKNPRVMLSDEDLIAAALLFGARDGWLGLANKHRRRISDWTTSLMASKLHGTDGIQIQIPDKRPKPLREFFSGDCWDTNKKHAFELAQKCKWNECMQTWIKVSKSFRVEELYLILPGDVKTSAIKSVVDKDSFLKRISQGAIDDVTENTIRVKISGSAK
jgi:hypothetical protein